MPINLGGIQVSLATWPLQLLRYQKEKKRFFDHPEIKFNPKKKFPKNFINTGKGYQSQLFDFYQKYKGERCFIIGNGPSLRKMDLSGLENEFTLGSNGIYKIFKEIGFEVSWIFFEDREQTYLRRKEINRLKGIQKIVALSNSYCIKKDEDTIFFNDRFPSGSKERPFIPRFSKEFSSVAYLGGTISYVMMQWAHFLGFDEIYLLGIDHNYGKLPELFPPGKIEITDENIDLIKGLHFSEKYYKVGDVIGVPDVGFQNDSYELANKVFEEAGKQVINIGVDSKLGFFKKMNYQDVVK